MNEEENTEKETEDAAMLKQMMERMQAAEYRGLTEEEIEKKKQQKEMRKKKNMEILEDTLGILEKGSYSKDGKEICLRYSSEEMREIQVYLPEEIQILQVAGAETPSGKPCTFGCENADALAMAGEKYRSLKAAGEAAPQVLVLNLASATQPGGRTREGASAQEEDLCRRTSLLLSLESTGAKKYYEYNNARKTRMGSDAVMLSPYVEVLKDAKADTLPEPFPVSVLSCAAPMVRLGLEGMTQQEYEAMLCRRIRGMLKVAASQNYRHLILGAFGCGVYGNDAALVSDLFYRAIMEFGSDGTRDSLLFDSIDFAVLCSPEKDYNYREFARNFG
ncbi:MAG: TIGR02452 family protein [Lachnospiraceae bacterium]|nr:TIGR02452 family protein [Lachnospiraceae bacterium]